MNGRVYEPVAGRFLEVDPIVQLGFSQSSNTFAYVWNNPLTLIDPTGFTEDFPACGPQDRNGICSFPDLDGGTTGMSPDQIRQILESLGGQGGSSFGGTGGGGRGGSGAAVSVKAQSEQSQGEKPVEDSCSVAGVTLVQVFDAAGWGAIFGGTAGTYGALAWFGAWLSTPGAVTAGATGAIEIAHLLPFVATAGLTSGIIIGAVAGAAVGGLVYFIATYDGC